MTTAASLPLLLARWFEARLHETWPIVAAAPRLYALDVVDPAALDALAPHAARVTFLGEASTVVELRDLPVAGEVRDHDAAAVVEVQWLAVPQPPPVRPRDYPRRRRARVVRVVTDAGSAGVIRFADAPDVVLLDPAA